jgi:hypothetical protein
MSPVYDLPDGPFSAQAKPIGNAPVWSATRYIRTDHFADEGSVRFDTVPASSANLDYQFALHTNAGIRQLSLQEFLT